MLPLYEKIEGLCHARGINVTEMCRSANVPRSALSDYKAGRKKTINLKNLGKIADFFNVTLDELTGREQQKAPSQSGEREIGFDDFTYALNGEVGELTESDKQLLLSMARQLNEARKLRDGTKAD